MIQPISFQTSAVSMSVNSGLKPITTGANSERVLTTDTKDTTSKVSDTSIKVKKDSTQKDATKKDPLKDMKDVVAVSKDGDTVQVSNKGQERYENEIAAQDKSKEKAEKLAEEMSENADKHDKKVKELAEKLSADKSSNKDEDSEQPITSLAGYTNSQLKQLYLKGDISQYAYESRVEQKEEALSNDLEANKKDSEEITKNIEKADSLDRKMSAIENAFSSDASDTLSAEQKMDVLNKLDGTSDQEKNSQLFNRWQNDFQFLLA